MSIYSNVKYEKATWSNIPLPVFVCMVYVVVEPLMIVIEVNLEYL